MKILALGDSHTAGHCWPRLSPAGQAYVLVLKRDLSNSVRAADADLVKQQARALLAPPTTVAKNIIPLILVSHPPAIGTIVDRLHNTTSVGSQAIRNFIENNQPDLRVCGHIREAAGSEYSGRTAIYNRGALISGGWRKINILKSELRATLHESF